MLGIAFITPVKRYSLSYIINLVIGTNRCLLLSITEHDTNLLLHSLGRYSGSDGKESAYNAGEQVQSLGQADPLEKGMATHYSILTWRTPWTEDAGGLCTVVHGVAKIWTRLSNTFIALFINSH